MNHLDSKCSRHKNTHGSPKYFIIIYKSASLYTASTRIFNRTKVIEIIHQNQMWSVQKPPEGDLSMYSSSAVCRWAHYHQISGRNHSEALKWCGKTALMRLMINTLPMCQHSARMIDGVGISHMLACIIARMMADTLVALLKINLLQAFTQILYFLMYRAL